MTKDVSASKSLLVNLSAFGGKELKRFDLNMGKDEGKLGSQVGGFDCKMFARLSRILRIIFPKLFSIPTSLFVLLLLLCVLEQVVAYHVGLISSRYYQVLGDKDFNDFLTTTLTSSLLVLGMALILTSKSYVSNVLYIVWRQILGQTVHLLYFSGINYYSLNVLGKSLDNPDQRMTQDIDMLCKSLSLIIVIVIVSPFKIAYYSYKTYQGTGWIGPVGVFVFFLIGTLFNKLVMSPIVRVFMEQEKQEGNFRYKHMHVRVNAEAIAFHVSGHVELNKTNEALNTLIRTQQRVFNRQFWLKMIENTYDYMGSIVSFVVISIPIFEGWYDSLDNTQLSSMISKNSFLCMTLMYSFSQLVDLTSQVVALSGVTHRVAQLIEKLNHLQISWDLQEMQVSSSFSNLTQHRQTTCPDQSNLVASEDTNGDVKVVQSDDDCVIPVAFILKNVSVVTPDTHRVLFEGLNLEITKNDHLLIMGPSSCGKSSLLRLMRGLWPAREGTVAHNLPPGPKTVIFLPQKSLLTNGSLYEQVIYPLRLDSHHPPTEETLNNISDLAVKLRLQGLLDRCGGLLNDIQWNWDDALSPGEMQRVCFMRIFYHQPQYAFLDEATSALSVDVEEYLYSRCLEMGITLVSVGHRHSLQKFHRRLLLLGGDGTWRIEDISNVSASAPESVVETFDAKKKL